MNGPVTASIFGPYSPAVKRLGSPSTSVTSSCSATTVTAGVDRIGLWLRMNLKSGPAALSATCPARLETSSVSLSARPLKRSRISSSMPISGPSLGSVPVWAVAGAG